MTHNDVFLGSMLDLKVELFKRNRCPQKTQNNNQTYTKSGSYFRASKLAVWVTLHWEQSLTALSI